MFTRFPDDRHTIDLDVQAARFDRAFPKIAIVLTDVTQGLGDVGNATFGDGPKGLAQYVLGATDHLGETTDWSNVFSKYRLDIKSNPVSRVVWAAGNMVYGILHLATGPESYDARGVTQWGMSVAMVFAMPQGIKAAKVMTRGAARMVPVLDQVLVRGEQIAATQQNAATVLAKVKAADDAAFALAWENTAPAGQMGALEIPSWMLPALTKADLVKMFRQEVVTNADLQTLTQHADVSVVAAAKQVLAERTSPYPVGYQLIPATTFKGQELSPFAMKATPVTNAEWLAPLDGNRYVLLRQDTQTLVVTLEGQGVSVEAVSRALARKAGDINFDQGAILQDGGLILVKLVDSPSAAFDAPTHPFSAANHPVVGVNYYQAQAWLAQRTAETGGRLFYRLPNDAQFEHVASNGGQFVYGTEFGQLAAPNGRKLAHWNEHNNGNGLTAAVDDPRYAQKLPFGVQTTGNVWRWIEVNQQERYPYGLRGGSWGSVSPVDLRAAFRDGYGVSPVGRYSRVGFSPLGVLQDSIN